MSTVPHPIAQTHISFRDALDRAELLARQSLPEVLHERLTCAVALVKDGKVMQLDDGHTWEVESASVAGKIYSIDGAGCSCEDAQYRAHKGLCKHTLATLVCRKAMVLIRQAQAAQAETPTVAPPAPNFTDAVTLPEARASCNVRVLVAGHEVQWTLRGHDEAEVFTRLQTLLARKDVQPLPPRPAPRAQGQQGQQRRYQGAA